MILSNDAEVPKKLDTIAFPDMTSNFDATKSAALAVTMLDWRDHGTAYATKIIALSKSQSNTLDVDGAPVFLGRQAFTNRHQFAIMASPFDVVQRVSKTLRQGAFLACGIGLPRPPQLREI